jgi:hypothetical protein
MPPSRPTGSAGGFVVVNPGKAIQPVRPPVGNAAPSPWPGGGTSTPTPAPTPMLTIPVQDWRAVVNGNVTDLTGVADTAMTAQQASKATKVRGASFAVAAGTPGGRIFPVAAHAQPLELYWWGLGTAGTSVVDISTDGGATWTSTGFADLKVGGGTLDNRTQYCGIPAGGAKLIRLTCSGGNYTVWPQLHEAPASGLRPVFGVVGNSIPHYPLAGDVSGTPATTPASFMNAMIAAAGGDPIVVLLSEPSAQISGLQSNLAGNLAKWPTISTMYLCGLIGGDATALHPYQASQKASLETAIDTYVNQVKAAGKQIVMDDLSFMFQATDELPQASLADQSPGRGLYNVNIVWNKIQQHSLPSYNADLAVSQSGMYFWSLFRSPDIAGDGKHPSKDTYPAWQGFMAGGWYRFVQTGAWPVHQVYQRINTAEASLLASDYGYVVDALQLLPATAAKTAIVTRQAALRPLMLLKTANVATAAYEASKTAADKTAAQNAITAAVNGGASTANTNGLSGTNELTSRVNAVVSVTVTKRVKMSFGSTAVITGVNQFASATQGQAVALVLTDGTTASGHTGTLTTISGAAPTNGISIAAGTAPNDFAAGHLRGYITGTSSSSVVVTLTGLDPTKKYRFYAGSGFSTSTADRSFALQAVGANTVTSGAVSATTANTAYLAYVDNVAPTSGGQVTLTLLAAGTNSPQVNAVRFNGLNYEEVTA